MEHISGSLIFVKGDVGKRRTGFFSKEKGRIYVRCPQCLEIVEIDDPFDRLVFNQEKVYRKSQTCAVCWSCADHFFPAIPTPLLKHKKLVGLIRREFGADFRVAMLTDSKKFFQLSVCLEDHGRDRRIYIYRPAPHGATQVTIDNIVIKQHHISVEEAIRIAAGKYKAWRKERS